MGPLREMVQVSGAGGMRSVAAADVRDIGHVDFTKALRQIRPTVSDTEVKRYEDWNAIYGCAT